MWKLKTKAGCKGGQTNFAVSVRWTLVPPAVCVSATRANTPDKSYSKMELEYQLRAGRGIHLRRESQTLGPFLAQLVLVFLSVVKQRKA